VAARQLGVDLVILVCNNGESVSLKKQAVASYGDLPRRYLDNASGFDYGPIAEALGIHAERVEVPVGRRPADIGPAATAFAAALARAAAVPGPALVELVLPADPAAWEGIWVTQGFEQAAAVPAR
jgi:acetolactate synthase-1/2/3 large subunit